MAKTPNRQPSPKQIVAAKKTLENLGSDNPKPMGTILRESGYSAAVAKNPDDVVQSTGFQKVLEEAGVTDEKLSKVLDEGLSATDKNGQPDYSVRHKYLETGVKLKGHVGSGPDAPPPIQQNNQYNFFKGSEVIDEFTDYILEKTKLPIDED